MQEDNIVLKFPVEKIPVEVTVTKITRWKMKLITGGKKRKVSEDGKKDMSKV